MEGSSQEGRVDGLGFADFDIELFDGLLEVFDGVDEESFVDADWGKVLLILAEDGIGDSRFVPGSAFGRFEGVHVDEDAFGLFRGDC